MLVATGAKIFNALNCQCTPTVFVSKHSKIQISTVWRKDNRGQLFNITRQGHRIIPLNKVDIQGLVWQLVKVCRSTTSNFKALDWVFIELFLLWHLPKKTCDSYHCNLWLISFLLIYNSYISFLLLTESLKIKLSSGHLIALWKKRCGMDQKKLIM